MANVIEYYRQIIWRASTDSIVWFRKSLALEIALPLLTTICLVLLNGLPINRQDWVVLLSPFIVLVVLILGVFLCYLALAPYRRDAALTKLLGTYTPRYLQVFSGSPFVLGEALVVPDLRITNVDTEKDVDLDGRLIVHIKGDAVGRDMEIASSPPTGIGTVPAWRKVGDLLVEPLVVGAGKRKIGYIWGPLPLRTDASGFLSPPGSLNEIESIRLRLTNAINHVQLCDDELWPAPAVTIWVDGTGGPPSGTAILPTAPRM